jgi:gliding motility associated protien GldN
MAFGMYAQPLMTDQPVGTDTSSAPMNTTWLPSLTPTGIIDKVPHSNKVLDMVHIREIDVAWSETVWSNIDTREKQNQAFVYDGDENTGGGSFIEILIYAIRHSRITAYSGLDDKFTTPLSIKDLNTTLSGTVDSQQIPNPETGELEWRVVRHEFEVHSVTKYQIKEECVFDRNQGRMIKRIVAIAPMSDRMDEESGKVRGSVALFWLKYEDLRKVLGNYEVYNPLSDVNRMTWTDFLDNHMYSSYAFKTTRNNPMNLKLGQGLRELEAGDRIIESLREREDDMWQR